MFFIAGLGCGVLLMLALWCAVEIFGEPRLTASEWQTARDNVEWIRRTEDEL